MGCRRSSGTGMPSHPRHGPVGEPLSRGQPFEKFKIYRHVLCIQPLSDTGSQVLNIQLATEIRFLAMPL